ncbi:hydroxycinnamoyltransferase 4-like [Sorghum bicolor]|nr:hydroxycinnamoyltransferase 4 [Sorghum bicolor]XP_021311852.1 hydroxycinnamoyltransferase 4-like [Sorghum bicolor]|eukprot:XP_002488970.2 hydroxycinnamoyltransferase 4 [Sorghum bicolor]
MKSAMDFEVQVIESSFVTPSEPAPRKVLWLSSLDLSLANQGHTPTIYLYSSSNNAAAADPFFDVARLKEAMARALVAFYPLAGRLGVNDADGRMEISCNGEGALFIVAQADDFTANDVKKFKPSPELRRLFVPLIEPLSIILAVQVTFLKCGGVVLGTALHHAVVDALSAFHFFQTWSTFSKHGDCATVELPCHDRDLLRARSPPTIHPDALLTFYPKHTFFDLSGPLAIEVFTISRDQVAFLKHLCGGGTSTFCAVSALVWQCTCVARRLSPDSEARLTFPANLRQRMRPPLPSCYIGNAMFYLGITSVVRDIATEVLGSVAGRIRGVIDQMDDELVHSAIDYFEMAEMDNRPPRGTLPQTVLHITSWLGLPQYDADFGWGKPELMSRAQSHCGGFVNLMNDDDGAGSGGVRLLMCMEAVNIKEIERLLYAKLALAACS